MHSGLFHPFQPQFVLGKQFAAGFGQELHEASVVSLNTVNELPSASFSDALLILPVHTKRFLVSSSIHFTVMTSASIRHCINVYFFTTSGSRPFSNGPDAQLVHQV